MRISDWSSDVCSSDLMETSGVTTSVPPALRQLTVAVMSPPGRAAAGSPTLISTRPALASSDSWKAPVAAADPSAAPPLLSYRPGHYPFRSHVACRRVLPTPATAPAVRPIPTPTRLTALPTPH